MTQRTWGIVAVLLATGCGDDGSANPPDAAAAIDSAPPDAPLTQLDRIDAYIAAWSEADDQRRRALLELSWTDDGVYEDPTATANGRDALDALMTDFQTDFPGAHLERTSAVQIAPGDHIRFAWKLVDAGGNDSLTGQDLGELAADDRLRRITGFFGAPPAPDGQLDAAAQARLDAWNEPDATARAALVPIGWIDTATFVDEPAGATYDGATAISAAIDGLHAAVPGAAMVLTSDVDGYGDHFRASWELRDAGGTVVSSGLILGHLAGDGRSAFEASWSGADPP